MAAREIREFAKLIFSSAHPCGRRAEFLIQILRRLFVQKNLRRADACFRNKRSAARTPDSAGIAIFAEHSTGAMHNTIISPIA
jgi:hypothetical protein